MVKIIAEVAYMVVGRIWIQLFGVMGVIASLVFVRPQMRQTQQIALVAPQTERLHKILHPDPPEGAKVSLERNQAFFSSLDGC